MITTLPTTKSEVTLAKESVSFKLEANSKAFAMLIDKIYSNPVRATISELAANGNDAHIEANNPNPFDIKLPTALDPFFYVRDFGNGMSHEFVMSNYNRAFFSTKDNSNEYTGSFGIGKLAALSVSGSFNLISYDGKTQRSYSITLETGIPQIHYLGEKESNEPKGVKISFAVPNDMIYDFEVEARDVFKFYEVIPNFVNKEGLVEKPNFILSYEKDDKMSWGIMENQSEPKVVMGHYVYGLNVDFLRYDSEVRDIASSPFLLKFGIGEVDVTSNRQSLSYSDKTKSAIKNKLIEIKDHFKEKFEEHFKDIDSYYECCQTYSDIAGRKFKNICKNISLDGKIKKGDREVASWFSFDKKEEGYSLSCYSNRLRGWGTGKKFKKTESRNSIIFSDNIKVLINDTGKKLNRIQQVCEILKTENNDFNTLYVINFDDEITKKKLVKKYGLEKVEGFKLYYDQTSAVPKSARKTYTKCVGFPDSSNYFKDIQIDLKSDEFVFGCVNNSKLKTKYLNADGIRVGGYVPMWLKNIMKMSEKPVIFIKQGDIAKIKKNNSKAVFIDDYLDKIKAQNKNVRKLNYRRLVAENLLLEVQEFVNYYEGLYSIFSLKNLTKNLTKKQKEAFEVVKHIDSYDFNHPQLLKIRKCAKKVEKNVLDKFPLLPYIPHYRIDKKCVEILKKYDTSHN